MIKELDLNSGLKANQAHCNAVHSANSNSHRLFTSVHIGEYFGYNGDLAGE
jgi:hypothetical protein